MNWKQLKFLPNIRIIKSMVYWMFIVPIIAKALQHLPNPLILTIANHAYKFDISLPFSWYLFFFAALFFSMGNLLYELWCPKIIKDHITYAGFKGDRKMIGHLNEYAKNISLDVEGSIEEIEHLKGVSGERRFKDENEVEFNIQQLFWGIYEPAKTERFKRRLICCVSYYLGFIFTGIVIIVNLYWVVTNLLK